MGGMLLAKAFLPSGAHIKEALAYADIAIKTEIVLHELYTTMFWFSLMELGLFTLGLLLFFSDPEEMYTFWIHIFHIGRGIIGLVITRQMPKPHQMAANMSIPSDEKLTL